MVFRLLTVRASSASSERDYCSAARIITPNRSHLSPLNVVNILLLSSSNENPFFAVIEIIDPSIQILRVYTETRVRVNEIKVLSLLLRETVQ